MASASSSQNKPKHLTPAANDPFQVENQYMATKSITFTLSHLDKPLTFILDTFSSVIGLKSNEPSVLVPQKEIVKAGLETLGLFDKDDPSLSSNDLVKSSPMKVKYFSLTWKVLMQYIIKCLGGMQRSHDQLNGNQRAIVYCLCWGLNIDIANILFSDLILHLHPEGAKKERKPNVCYTRYVSLIIEHLLQDTYKNDKMISLKPYNITTTTFKPTLENETVLTSHMYSVADLLPKPLQNLIPPSGEVNADDIADKSLSGTSVPPVTQPKALIAKNPRKKKNPSSTKPKSIETSESAEVLDQIFKEEKEAGDHSLDIPTVKLKELLDKVDRQNTAVQETLENNPDYQALSDSDLDSMLDADLRSVSEFKTSDSDNEPDHEVSHSEHISQDENAFAERLSLPDHLDHICEKVSFLHSKLGDMESLVVQQDSLEIKSSIPALVTTTLKEQLPALISEALKDCLLQIIKEAVQSQIPSVFEQVAFTKVLKADMGQSLESKVQQGMHDVRDDLTSQSRHLQSYCKGVQSMQTQLLDIKDLLKSKVIIDETAEGEKNKKDENTIPDPTQGEHQTAEDNIPSKPTDESQGEQPPALEVANKDPTPPVSEAKVNEEMVVVLHNSKKKMSDEIISMDDESDYDELNLQPLSKRFKIMTPIPKIPKPTTLSTFIPEHLLTSEQQQ
ncbi:hypothetical protein Tco_1385810 [Tanacetum coccineum]